MQIRGRRTGTNQTRLYTAYTDQKEKEKEKEE
jgi:hypothetical protein